MNLDLKHGSPESVHAHVYRSGGQSLNQKISLINRNLDGKAFKVEITKFSNEMIWS